jgi:hypothetical protein
LTWTNAQKKKWIDEGPLDSATAQAVEQELGLDVSGLDSLTSYLPSTNTTVYAGIAIMAALVIGKAVSGR